MVASGLTFGSRKVTHRMHPRSRPGGSGVKTPLRGAFQKFANFREKKLSRVSRPPYHHRMIGRSRTKNAPGHRSLRGAVGELGPPKNVIFVDYILRFLRIAKFNFRVTSHIDTLSMEAFFAIFGMVGLGVEHPQNWPPKNRGFLPSILNAQNSLAARALPQTPRRKLITTDLNPTGRLGAGNPLSV